MPHPDISQPVELLTVADFIAIYRISIPTFYRLVRAGEVPIIKIGRATRIHRADAERWAAGLARKAA